jgi:hypothetical protein
MLQTTDARFNLYRPVTPEDLARMRAPWGEQSPSLNPTGALAALSRAHANHSDDADEMVVGIDVFSNGTASLADVVQAPRDRQMLDDFESALRRDPSFVKASLDKRPDTMRVFFAMGATQKVEVSDRNF